MPLRPKDSNRLPAREMPTLVASASPAVETKAADSPHLQAETRAADSPPSPTTRAETRAADSPPSPTTRAAEAGLFHPSPAAEAARSAATVLSQTRRGPALPSPFRISTSSARRSWERGKAR